MDKQKQIEEMAKVLSTVKRCDTLAVSECIKKKCEYPHYLGVTCIAEHQAEALYNAGYRKIPENSVLTREEYDELKKGVKTYNYTAMFKAQDAYRWEQGYLQGCKETAEKFAERLKSDHSGIESDREGDHLIIVVDEDELDEICKEFTEGRDEGKET